MRVVLTGGRRADVGAEREWVDALDGDHTDAGEWRQGGREDGAALHEDGQDAARHDGRVVRDQRVREAVVAVHSPLDQLRDVPAAGEATVRLVDDTRRNQQSTHVSIELRILTRKTRHMQSTTTERMSSTTPETVSDMPSRPKMESRQFGAHTADLSQHCTSRRAFGSVSLPDASRSSSSLSICGEATRRLSGQFVEHCEVTYLDDHLGEWLGEGVEELPVGGLVLLHGALTAHDVGGEVLEVSRRALQRQQHQHGQPVEHVVHGGGRERPPELVPVGRLHQRHNRVGHRRADVRAHHDGDGLPHFDDCRGGQ